MSKKKAAPDAPEAPAPRRKERERQLTARVDALEAQVAALSAVVDAAMRATITPRAKATAVKPRQRKAQPGSEAPEGP